MMEQTDKQNKIYFSNLIKFTSFNFEFQNTSKENCPAVFQESGIILAIIVGRNKLDFRLSNDMRKMLILLQIAIVI